MRRRLFSGRLLYLLALRVLAMRVPRRDRAEWKRQWASELWYVYDAAIAGASARPGPSASLRDLSAWLRRVWTGHRAVASFCLGAFEDARSMRAVSQSNPSQPDSHQPRPRSAAHCLGALAAGIAFSLICVLLLPGARDALRSSPYRDPHTLVLLSRAGDSETLLPTIPVEQYRSWREHSADLAYLFEEFALYQPSTRKVEVDRRHAPDLLVASVTPNLFALLGLPSPVAVSSGQGGIPSLLLSEATWRKHFGGDPGVFGRLTRVGGRQARIAGIFDAWTLPGQANAWLIETGADASSLPASSLAYVVGRQSAAQAAIPEYWHISEPAYATDSEQANLSNNSGRIVGGVPSSAGWDCVSLSAVTRRPLDIFFFTVMLALLALPATTSLPLGEYPASARELSRRVRTRRWAFLFAKSVLIFPIVLFASVALSHALPSINAIHAQYIQIVTSFSGCLYGLRWALRDQRVRCPVCLCKLTHACRVGEASRNFLAWNGTELLCSDGHGLLHVPDLPTCWFPTQRWTYLDASWTALFLPSI